jgi:hypothetical protein
MDLPYLAIKIKIKDFNRALELILKNILAIREEKLDLIDNKYLMQVELKLKILKMKKVREHIYFYLNGIDLNLKYSEY